MKKILSVLLSLLLLCSCIPLGAVQAATAATVYGTVDQSDVAPGDTFTMSVQMENNPGLVCWLIDVDFDSAALELVSQTKGEAFSGIGSFSFGPMGESTTNALWYDFLSSSDYTNNGSLFSLTFRVKEDAPAGNYPVTLYCSDWDNMCNMAFERVDFDFVSPTVTVVAAEEPACEHEYFYACDAWCMLCGEYTNPGASHNVIAVESKAATCVEIGNIAYWFCELCGSAWLDAECTQITNLMAVQLPALDHAYDDAYDADCNACGAIREVPDVPVAGSEATLDFHDRANRISYTTEQQVWAQNGITFTNDKAASTSNVGDYGGEGYPVRCYKASAVTIESPGMAQIVFNCNDYKASYVTDLVASITDGTVTVNGTAVTVTFDAPVDSMFIPELASQVRLDSITVYTGGAPSFDGFVTNGDFETGDITGWEIWQFTTIDSGAAYEGNYGAHLQGHGDWGGLLNQTIPVQAGKTYELNFVVKVNAVGVNVQLMDGSWGGTLLDGGWLDQYSYPDWTKVTYTVTPTTDTLFLNFCGSGTGNAEDVYVDLVWVEELKDPSFDGFITNGDFETGDATAWELWQSSEISSEAAGEGAYGAHLMGNGGWGGLLNQTIPVQAGNTYEVSFRIQVNAIGVNMQIRDGDWNGANLAGDWYDAWSYGAWSEVAYTVTADSDALYLNFCGSGSGNAEDAYVDNVTVRQLKDPSFDGYIINGDFETGDITGWENLWENNTISLVDGRNGSVAMQVYSNQWNLVRQLVNVKPNTDYSITYWAKDVYSASLLIKDGNDTVNMIDAAMIGNDEWVQNTISFNSGNNTSVFICFMGTDYGAHYTVDDVVMTESSAKPTIFGVVDTSVLNAGDTFTLDVYMEGNPGLCGWLVDVSCDSAALELIGQTPGSAFTTGSLSFGPMDGGCTNALWYDFLNPDVTANGHLFSLTFRVKNDAPAGSYLLYLYCSDADNMLNSNYENVSFDFENTYVQVVAHTHVYDNEYDADCNECGAIREVPDVPVAGSEATLDFHDRANRISYTTEQQVWAQNGITFTNDKAASASNVGDYGGEGFPVRCYKASAVTIEYPGMAQIVFNCNDYKASYVTDLVASITDGAVTVNGTAVTVTFDTPVDSMFIPELAAQVRVDSIVVNPSEGGGNEPVDPDPPVADGWTVATELRAGVVYKLGLEQTVRGAVYYFTGAMNGYYGGVDTAVDNAADMFVEIVEGGYKLYFFNASGVKQYIQLYQSGTHYNFTFGAVGSIFTLDTERNALYTAVGDRICYMGTYGDYVTIGTLKADILKDTDYIARLYCEDGTDTPECTHVYDNACDAYCNVCDEVREVEPHNYVGVVTIAPTCGAQGIMTYTCLACGDSYTEAIPATGKHTYESEVTKAPTCGAQGVMTYTCDECGDSYTEVIPATGEHSYDNACDAKCNVCGIVRDVPGHSFAGSFACVHCGYVLNLTSDRIIYGTADLSTVAPGDTFTVTVNMANNPGLVGWIVDLDYDMDALEIVRFAQGNAFTSGTTAFGPTDKLPTNALWYDFLNPDVTANGCLFSITFRVKEGAAVGSSVIRLYCEDADNICNDDYENVSFDFVSAVVDVIDHHHTYDNACDANCNVCDEIREVEPHNYVGVVTIAPTCVVDGIMTYTCSACGDSYTEAIPCNGEHDYVGVVTIAPTCGAQGVMKYTCSACGDSYTDAIPATGKHTYVGEVTAPDCINGGYTTYTCSVCAHSYVDDVTAPLGHNYQSAVTIAPTCGAQGIMTYTCSACSDSYTDAIPATGKHTYESEVTVAPTCVAEGVLTYTCSVCADSYTEAIPATGEHTYDHDCDADCNVCGGIREVPGHSFVNSLTCRNCGYILDADSDAIVQGSVDLSEVAPGDTFILTVNMANNPGLSGWQVELDYDMTALEMIEQRAGDAFSSNGMSFGPMVSLPTRVMWYDFLSGDTTANGTMFYITFRVKEGVIAGDTIIKLYCIDPDNFTTADEQTVHFDFVSPMFTLLDHHHAYDNACDATCNVCGAIREVEPHDYRSVITTAPTCGAEGVMTYTCSVCGDVYTEAIPATGEHIYNHVYDADCDLCGFIREVKMILGDVNGDGKVNIRDVGMLQQYMNGWEVEFPMDVADVNGDGKVNIRDVGLYQQWMNGWEVDYPIGQQ